CMQALQAPCTF
nr:immunoglobulin light chain junction region [Macaca mulatta]